EIQVQIEKSTSDYDTEKLQERLAKLAGGVAVLNVGAATEVEMKEKKARVEDALHATRAAVEEGIVAGGGVALVRAIEAIDVKKVKGDQRTGAEIVRKALEMPLRQIVENAGLEGSVILFDVLKNKGDYGFDAQNEKFGSMFKMGIIDPTKVTRIAVENAASVASLLITTEALVAEKKEDEKAPPMPPGGGWGTCTKPNTELHLRSWTGPFPPRERAGFFQGQGCGQPVPRRRSSRTLRTAN
ncbi:MAG: hypothetical protein IIB42_05840, partial [Candidatus Marinimicrobia bacterium]|nr:hypothetical protein [Candidatus Neomarinimicrobiota bacterium]